MRDEFSKDVQRALALRVAHRCSNPACGAATSGPQTDEGKAVNVGVAAHITGASPGGPRYDAAITPQQRSDASNGVWLCQTCAKLVDSDVERYTSDVLRTWKAKAEAMADAQVGKTAKPLPALGLRIELPEPVNPVGGQSGGHFVRGWRFKVRLIAEGQPLDILEVGVTEEGVGAWQINEVFWGSGAPGGVAFPIPVERSTEFWIDATSPQAFDTKPVSVGPITLIFRDHTQRSGEAHQHVIQKPPITL
jgi:hypothetical protein